MEKPVRRTLLPGVSDAGAPPPVVIDSRVVVARARRRAIVRDVIDLLLLVCVDGLFLRWTSRTRPLPRPLRFAARPARIERDAGRLRVARARSAALDGAPRGVDMVPGRAHAVLPHDCALTRFFGRRRRFPDHELLQQDADEQERDRQAEERGRRDRGRRGAPDRAGNTSAP